MDKKTLTERDICTKFITPAVQRMGWDLLTQVREQVHFTKGRIIVRGKLIARGSDKFADYILNYKPNLPIALIEAKDNKHPIGGGMQQGLAYVEALDIPFVISSNGDGFLLHDLTVSSGPVETKFQFSTKTLRWIAEKTFVAERLEVERALIELREADAPAALSRGKMAGTDQHHSGFKLSPKTPARNRWNSGRLEVTHILKNNETHTFTASA